MTNITSTQIACNTAGGSLSLIHPRFTPSTSLFTRRRTVAARLHGAVMAIWRVLPALSSSTPSDDAIATLSHSDRLGERH